MPRDNKSLLDEVAGYYATRLAEHGPTARGVDWNGEESQTLRFTQLCKIIDSTHSFSVNDLGCGYASLYNYLEREYKNFSYSGFDVSREMIDTANHRQLEIDNARFVVSSAPDRIADYGIASGIFSVRLQRSDTEWLSHIEATLGVLDQTSARGFSFNCLTSYSDAERTRDYLYYANPGALFDYCKRHFSRNVALLHDYGLYEFTILVRKS
jgi:SAM-dependent methyltransferase